MGKCSENVYIDIDSIDVRSCCQCGGCILHPHTIAILSTIDRCCKHAHGGQLYSSHLHIVCLHQHFMSISRQRHSSSYHVQIELAFSSRMYGHCIYEACLCIVAAMCVASTRFGLRLKKERELPAAPGSPCVAQLFHPGQT